MSSIPAVSPQPYRAAVLLRAMTDDDLDAVLALNAEHVPAVSPHTAPALARLVGMSTISLVAEVDGTFAGFCVVLPPGVEYASPNYAWFSAHAGALGYASFAYLDRIAVGAAAQRRGVGRACYDRLVAELTGRVPVLFCEVNVRPRNDVSLAFHAAIGFREVGQQDTDGGAKRVSLLALDLV
jgi:predicted GNAT superfamily acetyltransferase